MNELHSKRIPAKFGTAEYVEKKSRFIGRVWPVESEDEAMQRINEIRQLERDARHNVWAYMLDEGHARCSDDGEPQGTGGVPVLDTFKKRGISGFCCIVTRYFGGILLGTGGLVRAYSKAAALALESAGTATVKPVRYFSVECDYSLYDRLLRILNENGCEEIKQQWGAAVTLSAYIDVEKYDSLCLNVSEFSSGKMAVNPGIIGSKAIIDT